MVYKFRWDEAKEKSNLLKHGIDFEEAQSVFFDDSYKSYPDEENSDEEERYLSFGYSDKSRLLVVVHTYDEIDINLILIRIISCRKVTRTERQYYEGRS